MANRNEERRPWWASKESRQDPQPQWDDEDEVDELLDESNWEPEARGEDIRERSERRGLGLGPSRGRGNRAEGRPGRGREPGGNPERAYAYPQPRYGGEGSYYRQKGGSDDMDVDHEHPEGRAYNSPGGQPHPDRTRRGPDRQVPTHREYDVRGEPGARPPDVDWAEERANRWRQDILHARDRRGEGRDEPLWRHPRDSNPGDELNRRDEFNRELDYGTNPGTNRYERAGGRGRQPYRPAANDFQRDRGDLDYENMDNATYSEPSTYGDARQFRMDRDVQYGHAPYDQAQEAWMQPGPMTGRGPRSYQRSNEAVREDVCERLTYHGQIDASEIELEVENGEITLKGTVGDRSSKRLAEDIAWDVPGVNQVHNRLRVKAD